MNAKIRKSLKNQARRCVITGIPNINEFNLDFLEGNITRDLNIPAYKRRHIQKLLMQQTQDAKTNFNREPLELYKPKVPKPNRSHEEMRAHAESLPFSRMHAYLKDSVLRKLGEYRFCKNYKHRIPELMREVEEEFYAGTIHEVTVDRKVIPLDGHVPSVQLSCYKFKGRTDNYQEFIRVRNRLKLRLFIAFPLMRKLLVHITLSLPTLAVDFADLRVVSGLTTNDIRIILKKKMLRTSLFLEGEWYNRVSKYVTEDATLVREEYLHSYLNAATGLLCLHISKMIRHTMDSFVDLIGDEINTPMLRVQLYYDFGVKLSPGPEQIAQFYWELICDISKIAVYLYTVEYLCMKNYKEKYIKLDIHQTFLDELLAKLKKNINRIYKPVVNHTLRIQEIYAPLYDLDTQSKQINKSDLTFDEGCELIEYYWQYVLKLRDMRPIKWFKVCHLDQSYIITHLRKAAELIISAITSRMLTLLRVENTDICEMFEFVELRAETVPKSTAELMELSKYMIWASVDHMVELTARVQEAIVKMLHLIEITTVTNDGLRRLETTINWVFNIKPILEKNASMLERVKFEFEEALQRCVAKLNANIAEMLPFLDVLNDMDDADRAREYILYLRKFMHNIREMDELQMWINKEEGLFKFPISNYMELEAIKRHLYPFFRLISVCNKWRRYYEVWMDGPFEYLDFEKVERVVDELYKELQKTLKTYRLKIKQMIADNNPKTFKGLVDDPDPLNQPAPLKLCNKTMNYIKDFRPIMTVISIFCSSALYQRHWDEMSEIAGYDMTPDAGTTLRKMVERGFGDFLDKYEIISTGAVKERQLWLNLQKMMAEWEDIRFKISFYKDTKISILTALDDIQAVLDDHIIKTLTLRGSVFVKHFEDIVRSWYEKITRMNNTLDEWGKVQSQWLYLLPIFSSKDIIAQMPEEGVLFKQVDNTYRRYMLTVQKDTRVTATAGAVGMLEAMQECMELLDKVNEGVANYLEKKRLFFSRFFFLSNDEMLEILSETKDPLRVQPHLRKCFEGICKLEFNDVLEILAMFSQENEKINFVSTINTEEAHGSVEKWLVQVEEQMVTSVRNELFESYENYKTNSRTKWVQIWPGQVILAISQIYWTMNVHSCLSAEPKRTMTEFHNELTNQLQDIVALIRSPKLSNLIRITIKALIVIDVHGKDVVKELIDKKVCFDNEFKWLAQLRYYWEEERCLVRMVNATIPYANEYLGNSDRLVITNLTDRCYRTLVGAYHLHLNGAPEGPAGTGKTETTKDLAKAIAVQCVVFNCSDGLDYKAMGKFFKGLASSGAWACFDEFNRIELEVLSVVAQQILSIVLAVRANLTKFVFEGTELILNPAVYICITMNPGYAGRSELPDNLKVLFRTVAMMVPDYAMIGEISLYSYGFTNARVLSVKIVTTYRLCSEQLSSQNHYDYGMRAVKTVLSACGNIKRKFPDENEDILLLRSLIDVNLPKFLSHDVPLFEGIISDLFPGIKLPEPDYTDLIKACKVACEQRNLQPRDIFLLKIIQTYEMMIVRHGFMLVGDPFSGKTSTLKVLADALTIMSQKGLAQVPVHYQFINPKSITMGQLYGQFDPISYEWTDGVVATCYRRFAMDERPDRNWVIFDGPVDAVWIENMNTVLDDNKKLCLTSGEVIQMTNSMSMIFEVMDLAQASPATVSRCGMIYLESMNLGWKPFFESWLAAANPVWRDNNETLLTTLFDWIIPACLQFINKNCKQYVYPGTINIVRSTMIYMEMILDDACEEFQEESRNLPAWIEATMMMAVTWGLAGILDADSRLKFDEFYKDMWKGNNQEYPIPEIDKIEVLIPAEGPFFDYLYLYKTPKGSWKYWPELVKKQKIDESGGVTQILVPTLDTIRYMYIINLFIKHNRPILLVGPTGTGKSFYLQDLLMNRLDQETFEPAFITFTAQTLANQTQDLIISKLVKGRRGNYGAPKGKHAVIFIDDLNMPAKEMYGAQPPIELLRQFFDHKHWYNVKTTQMIFLHNLLLIAAMGLVGGSRQDVYPRFLRHFTIFSINEFSDESMLKIFSQILYIALKRNGFALDVMISVQYTVNATLDLYKSANKELLPTPAKSHYIFNLRDFSRIIQGCGLLKKETAEDRKIFPKLWVHESLRIFNDRLVEDTDRNWLYNKLRDCVRDHFKEVFDMIFESMRNSEGIVTEAALKNLIFGTFLDTDAADDERKYEQIESLEIFKDMAMSCLEEYNSTHKNKMDIVLFRYALEHLSKICRILSLPRGSALLVGIGGSGRQSLTRLASTILGINVFQPEITKNYSLGEFRDDIKIVLKESGGLGKHTVFLFTEDQLKEDSFLQDIDSLLNSGEVPNLYPIDEKQEILELVRLAAQGGNRNLDISPLAVFSFFINRCKEKLHIILSFSPIGASFRSRLRLYPSLVNCCTIDWYEAWPEDALEMVAHHWMKDLNVADDIKDAAIESCKYFHVEARDISDAFYKQYARKTYVTSASYLDLIISYQLLTNKKQVELKAAKNRYLSGLDKLDFAAEQVTVMQKSLEELQPQLKEMTDKATAMLREIEHETIQAERASMLVREDEKVANVQAAAAQELKAECEADLAQAIPILEEAIEALNTLKPSDITLVKSMKNPPAAIKLVMAAVCVMKDVKPDRVPDPATGRMRIDFWGPSKRVLGDMNFLQQLKDFDKDHIPIQIITRIRKEYIPHKDFKPEVVAKASSAAEGLCKWIIAMDLYDKVAREVAPKKEKLEKAEEEYQATMAVLQAKRDEVARLEQKLADLNVQLTAAQEEQQQLQDAVDLCSQKLERAKKLIGGLGGERNRWVKAAEDLQMQYDCLPGDILISCGVIAYLAPFIMQYRLDAIDDWQKVCKNKNIPCSAVYDFCKVLGSEIKIQEWYIHGLPRDAFSTQNAIIQNTSKRWSLLIDPQNQANKWIKTLEKVNNLGVVKFSDQNYMKIIEHCIEFGMPVLVENIWETLDAPLDPLLFKKTFKQGGILVISLGESVIAYHPDFRLYLTSKLRNPHYMPEVFNKVTIVNFALTAEGLEDQLLGIVVANERPDLQRQKESLVIESAENRSALKDVEDNILKTLSETEGNILENETAIKVLDHSKQLAASIIQKQAITKKTEETIEVFRQAYKPVAAYSTVLYYSISDLPNVDPMYQYSLNWFIGLYRTSVLNSTKSNVLQQRIDCIIDVFTYNLYSNVCRSLFEKDKLLYSFILCTKVMIYRKQLDSVQYLFFLTGGIEIKNPLENPAPNWLTTKSWDEFCRLSDLPTFQGFISSFTKSLQEWHALYDHVQPQEIPLPHPWETKLTAFEKLMIIKILRPDKLLICIHRFIDKTLGNQYVCPPAFDLFKSYGDSNNLCPLIFILSPGADPIMALNKFAERKGFSNKFDSISLGQGQGPIAEQLVQRAMEEGSWVCLQNCHLALSWMPRLEKLCEMLDDRNTHDAFRLWLTSYPSDKFPVSILQNGVKITNEPPTGLHQNLRLSFVSDPIKDPNFFYSLHGKEKCFSKFLYAICFFHAVVQERRTFGPLGWNIPYGFNDSDLHISIQQLQMFLGEYEEVPYEALLYLIGECNYGGRVTDDWDRRLITTVLDDFINPDVIKVKGYKFADIDACYGLPERITYEDYLDYINKLPEHHPPEVFGLHKNAGITRDLQNTTITLKSLLLVEGEMTAGGGETDELLLKLTGEILAKLPQNFDLEQAMLKYPVDYKESMNTVLVQELERFNKLLSKIRSSLLVLQKAIHGLVVMTPDLELLSSSILLGRIPQSWASVSYPSLKSLADYIDDFLKRIVFLQTWYDDGKPSTFWVSGFFFTQAFLTGAKQNHARKHVIPIDQLDFDHQVIPADTMAKPAEEGVYINGLYVDGARWDRQNGHLDEQKPKILWEIIPVIWLKPILIENFKPADRYKSPVYKTSERRGVLSTTGHSTNYVLPIFLNTKIKPSHWIKRSVALLCQLN